MRNPLTLTFAAFAQATLARRIVRPGTLADYRRLLAYAAPRLGALRVGAIRREHVQECLVDASQQGLGPKSVRNLLDFVRSILRDAGVRVADSIRVKAPQPSIRPLGQEECSRLRVQLEQDPDGDALLVLLGTGLRRGELLALQPDDWHPDSCQVSVTKSTGGPTKSGGARLVDVPDWLAAVMERAVRRSGRLFDTAPRTLGRQLDRACRAAGVPRVRVHDLRHSRITQLLLQGVPPLYVCQQAGHHSPAFTMSTYGHLVAASPRQRREWCNA